MIGGSEKDAIVSVERKLHCLPQMMQACNKLGLDLDTLNLHPPHAPRASLCYCHNRTRPQ